MHKAWYVYIVRCADNSLYTGITTDLERRVAEHNSAHKAARYTRARQPVVLVYYESLQSRSLASKREWAIKQLKKSEKEVLLQISQDAGVLANESVMPGDKG